MATNTYIVKNGDTLWDISEKFLGSPYEWPRLWKHNNRKAVIASTGRAILNPDLIYPGQKIALPINEFQEQKKNSASRRLMNEPSEKSSSLQQQLKKIKTPIAVQYDLKDAILPPIVSPNTIIEIKMTGKVVLTSKQSLPITYVTNKGELETKMTHAANTAFGTLLTDMSVKYDESTGKVKLGMNLIAKSKTPNIPTTSVGIIADSSSPIPKIKYEIKLPELKGTVGDFNFVAASVSISLEVTPINGSRRDSSQSPADLSPERATSISPEVIATGLFITASLIIVGTLVEDFFTAGVGIADDPASFAAAATMYARGAVLWRGTTVVAQKALLPVTTRLSIAITPVGTAVYAH
jgi:LysM repeat protein